ncbi:MAG: 1,2-phenylacetyl-CoA epoxidase subunit PaaC [Longimicrobiales bacterium]
MSGVTTVEAATELPDTVRAAVRDLILCLADSKRLLGMRYAGWILGAPELEAGIAAASMAQDEWGHARLLYSLLRDFGDDVEKLEHGREAADYRSMEALDAEPAGWPGFVALNALADTALSVQFEALRGSSYAPLRQRVEKLLDEERFHQAHGAAWFRRLAAASEPAKQAVTDAAAALQPLLLAWFGPDSERARELLDADVVDAAGSELRARYLGRVAPLLEALGQGPMSQGSGTRGQGSSIVPADFDEARRRSASAGAPDEVTIRRLRGDLNRAFLMD